MNIPIVLVQEPGYKEKLLESIEKVKVMRSETRNLDHQDQREEDNIGRAKL